MGKYPDRSDGGEIIKWYRDNSRLKMLMVAKRQAEKIRKNNNSVFLKNCLNNQDRDYRPIHYGNLWEKDRE
jgi:hypothetical protein